MKFGVERLRNFCRLPSAERVILMQAWGFFLLAELALRILSFRRLLTLSRKLFLNRRGEPPVASADSIARTAWLVDIAGRYAPVHVTCLTRALVLSWLLGRKGIVTGLRIGVVRREGGLTAHAWLEWEGREILDPAGGHAYEPLFPMG